MDYLASLLHLSLDEELLRLRDAAKQGRDPCAPDDTLALLLACALLVPGLFWLHLRFFCLICPGVFDAYNGLRIVYLLVGRKQQMQQLYD